MSSNLSNNFETLFSKMDNLLSTKTVVGEPVHIGDVILIPLVDISFGLGAGAYDSTEEKNSKDAGAGGIGASITPSSVLVIVNGTVQLVNAKNQDSLSKVLDMTPGIISKVMSMFKKNEDGEPESDIADEASEGISSESAPQ